MHEIYSKCLCIYYLSYVLLFNHFSRTGLYSLRGFIKLRQSDFVGVAFFCCCCFLLFFLLFLVINVFTGGRTELPRKAIGPLGSNCYSRRLRTCIRREHISLVIFYSGEPLFPPPHTHTPSGSAHDIQNLLYLP